LHLLRAHPLFEFGFDRRQHLAVDRVEPRPHLGIRLSLD
jgi:hypothetical protein